MDIDFESMSLRDLYTLEQKIKNEKSKRNKCEKSTAVDLKKLYYATEAVGVKKGITNNGIGILFTKLEQGVYTVCDISLGNYRRPIGVGKTYIRNGTYISDELADEYKEMADEIIAIIEKHAYRED